MSTRSRAAALAVSVALAGTGVPAGCSADLPDDRPLVVVSTNILGDVVEEVVGDEAEVMTLMKPNADPHSFEISARETARLRSADLVVSNGLGLEEGLQEQLDQSEAEGVRSFVAGEHVDVLDYAADDAGSAPDPHFWTDPAQMAHVVESLSDELVDLNGVDAAAIEQQAAAYQEQLGAVADEMTERFGAIPEERRALVTNHHVFGYLAEAFDFRVIGSVIPGATTLAAPSASDLADLSEAIEENGVATIFAESSSSDRLVRALADEAGLDVAVESLFTESLTEPGGGAEDYLTMVRVNTERIAEGLG